jgi:Fe-S-cluster containining protein
MKLLEQEERQVAKVGLVIVLVRHGGTPLGFGFSALNEPSFSLWPGCRAASSTDEQIEDKLARMGKAEDRRAAKAKAIANADERGRVVLRVYQGIDETAGKKLAQLAGTGVVPTCAEGCSHCCNLEIPMTRAEGETLVTWLRANRTDAELDAIRARLRDWLAWYRGAYVAHVAGGLTRVETFFRHAPMCSLLEDRRCTVYPVRPVTCRNHLVSSPASVCDPAVGTGDSAGMLDVAQATYEHVVEIRRVIERQGGSFLASVHLLPEWLIHLLEVEREPWRTAPPVI